MSEAPERIWLDWPDANRGDVVYDEPPERWTQPGQTCYTRSDLCVTQADLEAARAELATVKAERDALRLDMRAIHHMTKHIEDEVRLIPAKGSGVTANNIGYANHQIREWSGRYAALQSTPAQKEQSDE